MTAEDLAAFSSEWVSRFPSTIADGASTNFRPTARAWPRSKC